MPIQNVEFIRHFSGAGEFFRAAQMKAFAETQCRLGLIDGVEVEAGRAVAEERFAEAGDDAQYKLEKGGRVVLQVFEA